MSCTRPKAAWATTDVDKKGREYATITFRPKKGYEPDYEIPCGKCLACKAEKRRDWGIRMCHEAQYHQKNCFLTLTYEEDQLPEKINKRDLDLFIARLRKTHKVRYFITGEYGELTKRPHYHAIIFGEDFRGGRYAYNISDGLWSNKQLERTWSHGNIAIADFTPATAMYTAGYVTKKIEDEDTFSIMSRRPPIGWQWARDHQEQLNRLGSVVIDGAKLPIPKAYFNWLEPTKFRPKAVDLDEAKADRGSYVKSYWELENRSREINLRANQAHKREKI